MIRINATAYIDLKNVISIYLPLVQWIRGEDLKINNVVELYIYILIFNFFFFDLPEICKEGITLADVLIDSAVH